MFTLGSATNGTNSSSYIKLQKGYILVERPTFHNGNNRPYCNAYDISFSSLYPESHRLLHLLAEK